jgi:hypothetical protein
LALARNGDTTSLNNLINSQALNRSQEVIARGLLNAIRSGQKGGKSASELAKHISKNQTAKTELQQLKELLKATKGPKKTNKIKEKIKDLEDEIRGHDKEMIQKWPDIAKDYCP